MVDRPRFANPPIAEALLDIRVNFTVPPSPGQLESFQEGIRERYPVKMGRIAWQGAIQLTGDAVQQVTRRGPEGWMFRDSEGRRSVQARQDGFTFNWLKPYDRWAAMRDEARQHWERYTAMFRPESAIRLALRYLNRLELPLPFTDFREYVRTSPEIAAGLPQGLQAFFMRLEIPDEARGFVAIVTETMESPVDDGRRLPFILDIDAIREATFAPDSPTIWETFEQLRDFKNEIFFKSITPRAEELFR